MCACARVLLQGPVQSIQKLKVAEYTPCLKKRNVRNVCECSHVGKHRAQVQACPPKCSLRPV